MILLHDLKEEMQLDRSKNISVHVSTCGSYDFASKSLIYLKSLILSKYLFSVS